MAYSLTTKDQARCIIHFSACDDSDALISPKDIKSWSTLYEAAKIRNHKPILEIAEHLNENEIPKNVMYHRKCRILFTIKRDLQTIKRRREEASEEEGNGSTAKKRPSRRSTTDTRLYDPVCIFCNKEQYLKETRSREKLIKAVQLRADETLRRCAIIKEDSNIIAVTSRDIVAAEAHYHISCYKSYTNLSRLKKSEPKESGEVDESDDSYFSYKVAEIEAYENLFSHIRDKIFTEGQIVPVAQLTQMLEGFMSTKCETLRLSAKKNIRRRLEAEFGESIQIISNVSGKLLLVPNTLSLKDVVLENEQLQREIKSLKEKSTDPVQIIDQASLKIRESIQRDMSRTPWPFHPSNVSTTITKTPELHRFFTGLLNGDPKNENVSERVCTLVESFEQDVIYAVTRGQYKPPKHILLPNAVKALTGNTELITTLNKLGHGISYSQLEENETALCLQKKAADSSNRVLLPSSIKSYIFTLLAWDNIDRQEETLSGKGTSHRVNGVVIQPKVFGPDPPPKELPSINRSKQRALQLDHQVEDLDVYISGSRVGPHPLKTRENFVEDRSKSAKFAQAKNILWILARQQNAENQEIPSWTGFNIKTRDQVSISQDVVQYLPTINAPATELSTVFEILVQSDDIRKQLCLDSIVVTLDQALYAKASEIVWKENCFKHIILRMGTFHTICNALSILGKRFGDGGLKDILIESQLIAEGSVNGVIDGKHYNRAVRAHKCIYEAMMRLAWSEFIQWLENKDDKDEEEIASVKVFLERVKMMTNDLCQHSFDSLLKSQSMVKVMEIWGKFLNHLRYDNGDLSAFWMSYLDFMETIVLGLLRGTREGNWYMHLHAIKSMIPWCFAYDKINYARYLTPYLAQMMSLDENHPEVFEEFKSGGFSVQLSSINPFGRIPVDQTTETTVNKDTKTPGGTTGFSLKPSTLQRHYLTAEYRSAFLGHLRQMLQGSNSGGVHTDLAKSRITKDEQAVSAVVDLVKGWINPFSENLELINISTAKTVPQDVCNDIKMAYKIGEKGYQIFREERMESIPQVKKFNDPMEKNKLKTFSSINKKKQVKTTGRSIILKADRSLFGRIIVMAQARDLRMELILAFPLGPLPWSLATPDGFLRKTNKATLSNSLQSNMPVDERIPDNSAVVIDGMALVQKLKADQLSFGEVAESLLSMVLREGAHCKRLDVVFDTYNELSIKNIERKLRGEETNHQLRNISSTQIVRQWRDFLKGIGNKTSLISFVVNEWKKDKCRQRLEDKILYTNVGDTCYKITYHRSDDAPSLLCKQEEADGRLLFHAANAALDGYSSVLICSEDTDVFIMCVSFSTDISVPLFIKSGTRTRTKVINVSKVASSLGADVGKAVIGMHAFTGCDTVSALAGRGKAQALKLIKSNKEIQETFAQLGEQWNVQPSLLERLEIATCKLYSTSTKALEVNDLRYHLFCEKKGAIESHQLPPCKDCLIKHIMRGNYQAAIWKRCLQQDPQIPSPVGHGWKMEQNGEIYELAIDWMDVKPAPEAILELLSCNCTKKCEAPRCVCVVNGLRCTDMCNLQECENQASLFDEDDEENQLQTEDDDNSDDEN